jgi:peptidoglycan/LPS O-acetylase OafA/YrhL
MSVLAATAKGTLIGVSMAGALYGYWLIFWDEDWEWDWRSLARDFFSLLFFIVMMSIWPFAPRRYKRNWGPVSFFFGFVLVLAAFATLAAFTMGWVEPPSGEAMKNALMPTIPGLEPQY